jgi:hypothetical protein
MSMLSQVIRELRDVERDLQDRPALARRVRDSVAVLEGEAIQWVGTTKAKRLLGIGSENTVKAWARLGLLRSRREPNGRLKVRLDDVLAQQALRVALTGAGDDSEMTPEEYAVRGAADLEDMSPEERMLVERARTLWAWRAGEEASEAASIVPGPAVTAPAHEVPDRSPR